MTSEEMRRALARISHEVLERNKGAEDLVLVGIETRGVCMAKRLAANIERFENLPCGCWKYRPHGLPGRYAEERGETGLHGRHSGGH